MPGKDCLGLGPATPATRVREPPPLTEPTGAAAAAATSTHRVRRWAGPLGTRTATPPRLRGGVSARHKPSGPPPGPRLGAPRRRRRPRLHGEGKRLRGDWAGGGDGGRGPGSEELARARLCQRRTRRSLAPDPALAVRCVLIGCSETGAGWPTPKGRLPALAGPALARLPGLFRTLAWAAEPGLTVSLIPAPPGRCACAPQPWEPWGSRNPGALTSRAPPPSAFLKSQSPGRRPSSQFTDEETEAKYKLQPCPETRTTWNSKKAAFPPLSPNVFHYDSPPLNCCKVFKGRRLSWGEGPAKSLEWTWRRGCRLTSSQLTPSPPKPQGNLSRFSRCAYPGLTGHRAEQKYDTQVSAVRVLFAIGQGGGEVQRAERT